MRVTQTLDELKKLLDDGNFQAWLRVIRLGETSPDTPEAYHALFGWSPTSLKPSFSDMSGHPKVATLTKWGWTSAAGAYQAMAAVLGKVTTDTWGECHDWCRARGHNLTMEPADQDLFAAWCTARRGAVTAVLDGQIETAIKLCAKEWASLPGSPYGQPLRTLSECLAVYARFGGAYHSTATRRVEPVNVVPEPVEKPAPIERVSVPTEWELNNPPQEPTMAPFLLAALPALIESAPQLARLFGSGSEVSERNLKAVEKVAEMAKKVTAQTTLEGAVQVLQTNPDAAARYREQVHQSMGELLGLMVQAAEVDEKTRATALDRNLQLGRATGGLWLYLLGGVAAMMVAFSFAVVWQVLFGSKEFSEGVKMLLLGQVVLAGFALVMAFLYGTNLQNRIGQQQAQERQQ